MIAGKPHVYHTVLKLISTHGKMYESQRWPLLYSPARCMTLELDLKAASKIVGIIDTDPKVSVL